MYIRKTKNRSRQVVGHIWLCNKNFTKNCLARLHVNLNDMIKDSSEDLKHSHLPDLIAPDLNEVIITLAW